MSDADQIDRIARPQERSAGLINMMRRVVPFALAFVLLLIGYITWLLLRYMR